MDYSREEIVHQLERVEQEGAYVGLARRERLAKDINEGKVTDLVAGVTRQRRWLDFIVDQFYASKSTKLEPRVRIVLRMGIFEILETRAAHHAVVNETVNCAKRMVGKRVGGLVNGILRRVIRERDQLPEPVGHSAADKLGIRYSHPTWMVERWLDRYGDEDTLALLVHNNRRPQFGVRIRVSEEDWVANILDEEGVSRSLFWDDYLRAESLRPVFQLGLISDGKVLIQDEAAGGVVRVLSPKSGDRVLDVCAAPGGKTFYCADLVGDSGYVLGVDQNEARLGLLTSEAARLGVTNIETRVADIRDFNDPRLISSFDKVLVDAPCSGFGVLSKRSDLRWRANVKKIAELQELQSAILHAAAKYVKQGGSIVYSTCTLEPEENEHQVSLFLESNSNFELENISGCVPEEMLSENGSYMTLPFTHGVDGAFAVKFRKT